MTAKVCFLFVYFIPVDTNQKDQLLFLQKRLNESERNTIMNANYTEKIDLEEDMRSIGKLSELKANQSENDNHNEPESPPPVPKKNIAPTLLSRPTQRLSVEEQRKQLFEGGSFSNLIEKDEVELRNRKKQTREKLGLVEEADAEEEDLLIDATSEMKRLAQQIQSSLTKDSIVLENLQEKQGDSLAKVSQEDKEAEKLLKSNQLGFITQMLMLFSALIVFCFMVVFIIIT